MSWWSLKDHWWHTSTKTSLTTGIGRLTDIRTSTKIQNYSFSPLAFQLDTKSTVHRGKVVRTPMRSIHEKLEHTVESVALPLAQAGISTVSCVLPLLLLPTYSSSVFVTAIVLVVTFGTIHSLVILPVFLYRLPESVTSFSIKKVCRKCCKQEKK